HRLRQRQDQQLLTLGEGEVTDRRLAGLRTVARRDPEGRALRVDGELVRGGAGGEDDRGLLEQDRQACAGSQPGIDAARGIGHGRREPCPDVRQPPQALGAGDLEEVPVQEEVVVQLQVSLTPDVERLVLLEGEVLPRVLHCQFHQPTHPLTGCGDDRPSSRFSTTSMQVRSERAPSSVTASSAVFLGSPAPSSVTSYQTKESPSSGSGFVQLKLTTPPA